MLFYRSRITIVGSFSGHSQNADQRMLDTAANSWQKKKKICMKVSILNDKYFCEVDLWGRGEKFTCIFFICACGSHTPAVDVVQINTLGSFVTG